MTRQTAILRSLPSMRTAVAVVRAPLAVLVTVLVLAGTAPVGAAPSPQGGWPGPPAHVVVPNPEADPKCPAGHDCTGVHVRCDWGTGMKSLRAWYATDDRNPVSPVGMVVFLSDGEGRGYNWSNTPPSVPFRTQLIQAGLALVHVRWHAAWNVAPVSDRAGMANLACRPVALLDWIYTQEYLPLDVPAGATGECGFCVVGNSDGADGLAYPLTHYGPDPDLDLQMDAVVPVSGPQQAAMRQGCQHVAGYRWDASHLIDIDESYGFRYTAGGPNPPPCYRHATGAGWANRWTLDGVESGGSDYDYPSTRIHLILGMVDATTVRNHARAWEGVLDNTAGCAFTDPIGSRCHEEFVPQMDVKVRSDPEGLAAVRAALVWQAPP